MALKRFAGQRMDVQRFSAAFGRRIGDISHALTWMLPKGEAERDRIGLEKFHNLHKGERGFILANGPSLTRLDLGKLSDQKTFGMNRLYLAFDRLGFVPTYYVVINDLVIRQFADDIKNLPMQKFLNWNLRSFFQGSGNTFFLRLKFGLKDRFIGDLTKSICSGGTVTFIALEAAYFMGFQEVILVGLDHRYQEQGTPNTVQIRKNEVDASHFHPNYFPRGVKWMLPDLKRSEQSYAAALEAYQRDGRRIYDATLDGNCQVFPKVNYDELF
jgi:hypothetical protein